MNLAQILPFNQASRAIKPTLVGGDQAPLARLFKVVSLALGHSVISGRGAFEEAPYDFDTIIKAIDTDSYVRQAFNKYRSLIWKEGWDIVGENPEAVSYLYQRLDFMELAMESTFDAFLMEAADQLVKFNNVFIAKVRGDLNPFFPTRLRAPEGKEPLVGYYIVPTETIRIKRDKHNNVKGYEQRPDSVISVITPFYGGAGSQHSRIPRWKPDEMIHIHMDRKPGKAFGTPFILPTLNDVSSLRILEEDILNLIHRELFPVYKYKVGTEDHPAEEEELKAAARELETMRSEAGLIIPERHDVEVIGAEGSSLDATGYLEHFKQRVAQGLGLSPHHLGMMMSGGNRSATDRLDIDLYDRIKIIQRHIAGEIQLKIFNELLFEGGYDPIATPTAKGVSDRCIFKFHEIDVDTQVKKENHVVQLWTSDLIGHPEARLRLNLDPEVDEADLYTAMQVRLAPSQPVTAGADGKKPELVDTTPPSAQKPNTQKPSTGGRPNLPNGRRGTGNRSRPANQHGRKSSPAIRHSDTQVGIPENLAELVDLLDDSDIE